MEELHIYDGATNGNTIHARQFDGAQGWTIEVCDQPKLARQLLATGATQRPGYDSVMVDASTEQLIVFLAAACGYRCKLQKKIKRQYSEETKLRKAEQLRSVTPVRNAFYRDVLSQVQGGKD